MPTHHLPADEFFTKLAELFESRQNTDHGSVFLTQKRLSHGQSSLDDDSEGHFADLGLEAPLPVLVRATNGDSKGKAKSKVKISTIVQPEELEKFYVRYGEVCKVGIQGLKKRDRKGKKATKAKTRKEPDEKK